MNHLNSVILEGNLSGGPSDDGNGIVIFFIESKGRDTITVEIVTDRGLAKTCLKEIEPGRGVRIVGYMAIYEDALVIHADHIEFKPKL